MNRALVLAFAAALPIFFTGCASVTGSPTQNVSIHAHDQTGDEVKGARCTLSNNKGRWNLDTPGFTTVQKSNQDMQVNCTKDGMESGNQAVASETLGSMYGNIIIGGGIGALIDHSSGAAYEYPAMVRILMRAPGKIESESQAKAAAQPTTVARTSMTSSGVRTLGPLAINSGKKPEIGDEWEYQSQDKLFGKRKKLVWRVKSLEPDGALEELVVDGIPSQQWLFKAQPEVIAIPVETGFIFGSHWDIQTNIPAMAVKGTGECTQRMQCSIVDARQAGIERIFITAGSFDAMRINGSLLVKTNVGLQLRGQVTVWYSEKDRRLLKQVVTLRSTANAIDETIELQAARTYQ